MLDRITKIDIRFIGRGNIRAQASIDFDDPEKDGLRITGFKIINAKYPTGLTDEDGTPLFLTPPAYPDNVKGGYKNIIHMPEHMWVELQGKVIREFLDKCNFA